mmetsp:Transcript_12439/g.22268  ORF Transcript_12439/g.22268 Transcript_12439/m.22268 type:complete len:208 (-) Transcript_12439:808-1431(-)
MDGSSSHEKAGVARGTLPRIRGTHEKVKALSFPPCAFEALLSNGGGSEPGRATMAAEASFTNELTTCTTDCVRSGEFTVGPYGTRLHPHSSMRHPMAATVSLASSSSRRFSSRNVRSSSARSVPWIHTESGITLAAPGPVLKRATVTTAPFRGDVSRETRVWAAITKAAPATTGSAARCGMAPCPPRPWIRNWNRSDAAMITWGRVE